jgi:hypothetical protein
MNMKRLILLLPLVLAGCNTLPNHGGSFFNQFSDNHWIFILLGWAFFPRMMFWFFSAMTGGVLFWLGVLFVPRIMVAFWATTYYWQTNPFLCMIAWFWAVPIESLEKRSIASRV